MKKYEAMLIIKPDLSEEEKKNLYSQIQDVVVKNNGKVTNASVWSEKRRMCFRIRRYTDGTYYLVNFSIAAEAVVKITHAYGLNENILRVLITRLEQ